MVLTSSAAFLNESLSSGARRTSSMSFGEFTTTSHFPSSGTLKVCVLYYDVQYLADMEDSKGGRISYAAYLAISFPQHRA